MRPLTFLTSVAPFVHTLVLVLGLDSLAVAQPEEPPAAPPPPALEPAPAEEPAQATAPDLELTEPVEVEAEAEADVTAGVEATQAAEAEASAAEETAAQAPSAAEDIIVTGTRIKLAKNSFGTAAPVDIIDRKQLERSGVQNLPALIEYLTATQGTGMMGTTNYNASSGQSAAAINLRGLGPGATLLLLNGRRMHPTGAATSGAIFADLSTIPLAAVERIEILRGGASAIYGADAVAGVVNIITRRIWNGARLTAEGQATQSFDQGEFTASASVGAIGPSSRLLGAISYYRRTELVAGDRDWPADKYRSPLGYPAAFATLGGELLPDPKCGEVLQSELIASPTGMGSLCEAGYRNYFPLLNNAERTNVFGSAEFDLNDHVMLFAEVLVSHYLSDNIQAPSFPVVAPYPLVPANHIDNIFPDRPREDLLFIGAPLGEDTRVGRDTADNDDIHAVAGIKGDLAGVAEDTLLESWQWELSASFGTSRYRESTADILRDEFQRALNSCSDPALLDNCFNPFYSATNGSGRPNPSSVIDSFLGRQTVLADHTLQTYNGGVSGSLWELPGGDLGIAFGAEFRREFRVTRLDHDANQLRYAFLVGNPNAAAARDVYSGYLELRWPLLDGLELQTAGRIERYTDTETTPSPFVGLTLTPAALIGDDDTPPGLRRLQVRAIAARAFRAPTIFNTNPGFATFPQPLLYRGQQLYIPVQLFGNPDLKPETAFTFSAGLTWQPIAELNLSADFWHYDYKHRIQFEGDPQQFLNNQASALEMSPPGEPDPHVITAPSGDVSAVQVRTINAGGSVITNGIDFGVTATIDGSAFGEAKDAYGQFSVGIQGTLTLTYDVPRLGLGLRVLPDGSVLGPADCKGSADPDLNTDPSDNASNDKDSCDILGKRNGNANTDPPTLPRLRANIPIGWTYARHSITAIGHFISGVDDDVAPLQRDGSFDPIPAWFSLDLQYGYTLKDVIGKQLGLHVGCLNLLDKKPSIVNGTDPPFAVEIHDPRGRMFYARLSAEF